MGQKHAFTFRYVDEYGNPVLANVLQTKVGLSQPSRVPNPISPPKEYVAIWDTGATGTVVTSKVVKELGLIPVGKTISHGVNGTSTVNEYYVNIYLPNNVHFPFLRVTECDALVGDVDVLVGMDIIGHGDFAVTNHNNGTVLSFRLPSSEMIDFRENSTNVSANSSPNRAQRRQEQRGGKKK